VTHSSSRRFWIFQTLGWMAFGLAMAFSRVGSFPMRYMLVSKGALTAMGFVLSLGLRAALRRLLRDEPPLGRILVACVALSYIAAAIWAVGDNLLDIPIATAFLRNVRMIRAPLRPFDGTVYLAFAMLAWSVLYVGIRHYQALEAARERSLRAEALAHRARLDALRYQLQPHFLFNTLNAISTLVVEERSAEAARMIARLSDFLRATLDAPGRDEIPLAEELDHARRYLDIEQVRFGERLIVSIDLDPEAGAALVPALVLQPLVENAIRHAVAPREAGGRITIEARRAGDRLHLVVADDGPGTTQSSSGGFGIGLANTRERLGQLYGDAYRLQLTNQGGTRVTIELPFHAAPRVEPAGVASSDGAARWSPPRARRAIG
jgi:signal transduction histidine kinase